MNTSNKDETVRDPKILDCVCASEYQDKRYGKGKRVHNPCKRPSGVGYRCTVCKRETD